MNRQLEDDLRVFRLLLFKEMPRRNLMGQRAPIRAKGGLVNVLGYGLKYLFGTADAKDVKRLADICDELHVLKMQMVEAANQQLTYLRNLDETTRQNTKDTIELAQVLRDSIKEISLKLNRHEADLLDTQSVIGQQVRYSVAIREVEMAILETRFSLKIGRAHV
jgi:hypothetical protein